ncbi:protein kinase [Streptomyces spectabilis]|uniref:Protein kinase n=1 Tax=Streptomyces spectabilis TaxID=68270 RepID=A0A7W8AR64_STRST|nr:protein kinase [Streptomyces spectabilis]MBB5103037.1 hypothetical protein [Streptomyces spectabilis]MCI3902232.1 protein kinase [Streptomyces spectabilis]
MKNRTGGRRTSILRERAISGHLQGLSPALRWVAENEAWIVLGFALAEGRRADFSPESADLETVTALLVRIGELSLPDVAHDWADKRWDRYTTGEEEAEMFRGNTLLHTDINPSNILIGENAAWVVDWAWPGRGAAFIDPALLVVQLIAAGHVPAAAESWAARCPGWEAADPKAIDAFASATQRMYHQCALNSEAEWLRAMETAAQSWLTYRLGRPPSGPPPPAGTDNCSTAHGA